MQNNQKGYPVPQIQKKIRVLKSDKFFTNSIGTKILQTKNSFCKEINYKRSNGGESARLAKSKVLQNKYEDL